MQVDSERFIALATRPLAGNAEVLLAGETELRNSIQSEHLSEATTALEKADRHPRRHLWRIAICVAAVVAALPMLVHTARQISVVSSLGNVLPVPFPQTEKVAEPSNLDPQQRLLLYGDAKAARESEKWKPLWESDPENPAYLVEYAAAYFRDHDELSPEILAEAERVDPENGWFLTLQASGTADGAVTKKEKSPSAAKGDAPLWVINDAKRLKDALSQVAGLEKKPRFASYQNDLLRERIALLPPRVDFVSQVRPLAYVASAQAMSIPFRKLFDAFAAGAQECAARGDIAGFLEIVRSWEVLVDATSKNSDTVIDHLIAKVLFTGPSANFRDAAKSLGLEAEAVYFAKVNERYLAEREAQDQRRKAGSAVDELIERRGSIFSRLTSPMLGRQVKAPPALTDEDFRPARYADHALFGRAFSACGWVLLVICTGLAVLARQRQSLLVRALSGRMLDLLRPADWAWILLGGVVFPALWYILISRFKPLASREWSIQLAEFIPTVGQFGALLVSMIVLPVVIGNWRLVKRGAVLGLAARHSWLGWLAAACALLAVPAFGVVLAAGPHLAFLFIGIPVLWILYGLVIQFAGRPEHALRRAILSRMILPAWVLGMLLMTAAIPLHYAEERHWMQQDRMGEISAAAPAMSRYEWEVTQIFRRELLEMIAQCGEID